MSKAMGHTTWFIPDCYWPEITTAGHYVSHESICVLNTGDADAQLSITLYFEDRAPMEGFGAVCGAQRTHHVRMDKLKDKEGAAVPMGVPYAAMVVSSAPIIVQYSRLDTTQPNEAMMSTIAHPLV